VIAELRLAMIDRLDFEGWDATEFDEPCLQLIDGLEGFSNVDWQKGTPKRRVPPIDDRPRCHDASWVELDL
jgi:hypothetical protein